MRARDLARGRDPQVAEVVAALAAVRPDVVLLTGIDYDLGGVALDLLAGHLAAAGLAYPHRFARRPNTGMPTGLDLDGDGRRGGPRDAQGFGYFSGQGGMAILSRWPLDAAAARDFSGLLWRDLPGALVAGAGLTPAALAVQRLSTTGHWDVPVMLPDGRRLHLWALHATPPVFDGPEDRNGRRNHDEAAFWLRYLDGWAPDGRPRAPAPFVILGDFNLDPEDGEGLRAALRALIAHPSVQDPRPASAAGAAAAAAQGGANAAHRGDPALDTADWPDAPGPGNMRADLVLPDAALRVAGAGVHWPAGPPGLLRHRLVWVDVALPPP
jgi:hypothetical protein